MDWLEQKYIGMLSSRLRNYKRKSSGLINFSCPICGDSQTHKNKARGYIYEYKLEKLSGNKTPEQVDLEEFVGKMKKPVFMQTGVLKGLKKISQLDPDHPAKQFVDRRKIPTRYHAKLFLCPNFKSYTNQWVPNKFENINSDETRLLIPFIDKEKRVHAYQGRSIRNQEPRYITIVLDETVPKVYGLDDVDTSRRTYVFEGPIDSMFVGNSIATAGGDLVSSLSEIDRTNLVIVYDNEPRSRETIKKIDKAILQGYSVCIWPENLEHKDVNDMVLAGLSPEFIKHIIDTNIYKDLAAKLRLQKWAKL